MIDIVFYKRLKKIYICFLFLIKLAISAVWSAIGVVEIKWFFFFGYPVKKKFRVFHICVNKLPFPSQL